MSLSTIFHKLPISGGASSPFVKDFQNNITPLQGTGTDTSGYLADQPEESTFGPGEGSGSFFKPLPGQEDLGAGRSTGQGIGAGLGGMPCLVPTIITVVTVGVLTLVQLLG